MAKSSKKPSEPSVVECPHKRTAERWIPESGDECWGNYEPGHYEEYTEYTTIDLDTFRYKCTMCGQVMFYSGGAQKLYEGKL